MARRTGQGLLMDVKAASSETTEPQYQTTTTITSTTTTTTTEPQLPRVLLQNQKAETATDLTQVRFDY